MSHVAEVASVHHIVIVEDPVEALQFDKLVKVLA
jgi:hypothetical protein